MREKHTTDRPKGFGPQRVLVIEDDVAIGNLLRIVLERNGYIVEVAADRSSAQTVIQDGVPSLILLDLGLPDGSGLDLLRWVRDDLGEAVPVVVLTAFRQDETAQKAFELGANDFIPKPFRPRELLARIERVLPR